MVFPEVPNEHGAADGELFWQVPLRIFEQVAVDALSLSHTHPHTHTHTFQQGGIVFRWQRTLRDFPVMGKLQELHGKCSTELNEEKLERKHCGQNVGQNKS